MKKRFLHRVLTVGPDTVQLAAETGRLGATKEWNTRSREWLDEFRTAPGDLHLPQQVETYDLGFAEAILTGPNRLLIDLGGTWYLAVRSKHK